MGRRSATTENGDRSAYRLAMVLTSVSFIIISVAVVTLAKTPVDGYELSIYQSTPLIFWIAIVFGLFNGGFLLLRFYNSKSKIWAAGLFELVLCNMLLVSIYLLRGSFFLGKGDALSYIGYSIDILNQGLIPGYNFYPIFTILISITTEITGLPVVLVTQLFPPFILMAYTLSIYCWAKSIFDTRLFVASMMFASVPIFFAWFMPPLFYQSLTVLVIPFFFYTLQKGKSGDIRFRTLTFILLIFFVLAHQLVAVGLMLYLIIIFIIERRASNSSKSVSIPMVAFFSIILLAWIFTQEFLVNGVIYTYLQIVNSFAGESTFGSAENMVSKVGILSAIQTLLMCTIDDIVFLVLSLLAGIVIWKRKLLPNNVAAYFFCLLGGCAIVLVLVVTTTVHTPFRMINLNFAMILTIPLVGYLLYLLRDRGDRLKAGLIIVVILISIAFSTASIYEDPINLNPNGTITTSEVTGNNWLISLQEEQNGTFVLFTIPSRFADMLYGATFTIEHPTLMTDMDMDPGDHFIRPLSSNQTYDGNYLIVSEFDEKAYTEVWESYGRFASNDFKALGASTAVSKIYMDSGMSCYICC